MYCPHCGKEIADGSYICPHCNQTVEEQQAQPQEQQNQYNPQYQQFQQYQQPQYNVPNQPVSGKKNICAIIGLVFACVSAFLTLIYDILLYGVGIYIPFLGVFYDILVWSALILSIVGMVQVKKFGQKGIAIAALSISIALLVFGFILNLILLSLLFTFI